MVNVLRLDEGNLVWDRPVEDYEWEVLVNGQQRTLSVDCHLTDNPMCKPMRMYMTMHGPMFTAAKERLMRQNQRIITNPNRWKISARDLHPERVGMTRFVGAPVYDVVRLWRTQIDPRWQFIMKTTRSGWPAKVGGPHKVSLRVNSGMPIDIGIQWPGIFEMTVEDSPEYDSHVRIRPEFIEWLRNRTKGIIFPFSDYKSTFELDEDEWVYMTDFHPALDIDSPED